MIVEKGRIVDLILTIVFGVIIYYYVQQATKGKYREVRRLPALDGIEEAVRRAVEMGRPIQMSTGMGGFGAETMAGLAVLSHLAKLCAQYGADLIVSVIGTNKIPVTEAIVQQGYEEAGKPEEYALGKQVRWLSNDQFAWAGGMIGIVEREEVAAQVLVGRFLAEALIIVEAGMRRGALQVAGTAFIPDIPFFVASCNYCLITEEIFAAGAYLSKDPQQIGSISGQDIVRMILLGIIAVGILAAVAGSSLIVDLLGV